MTITIRKLLCGQIKILVPVLVLFLLVSCSFRKESEINTDKSAQTLRSAESPVEEDLDSPEKPGVRYAAQSSAQMEKFKGESSSKQSEAIDLYKLVLRDEATFVNVAKKTSQANLTLSQLLDWKSQGMSESYCNTVVEITEFAVVDLDGDGIVEIILRSCAYNDEFTNNDFGFIILHYWDNEVYQYAISHRTLRNLKTDGSFNFSSGAANTGCGTLQFDCDGYTICRAAESRGELDADGNTVIAYFVDGKKATESEYLQAMNRHGYQPDAIWYAFNDENIDLLAN